MLAKSRSIVFLLIAIGWVNNVYASAQFETMDEYVETARGVAATFEKEDASFDVNDKYFLALAYHFGLIFSEDQEKAFSLFMRCGESGSARCMTNAGVMLADGVGTDKNEQKAFELMNKAADAGYDDAKENLAIFLVNGVGTKKDVDRSRIILRKLAKKGRANSIYYLALSLIDEEKPSAIDEAIEILGNIADSGNGATMNLLAEVLVSKRGSNNDLEKAARLFDSAVKLGNRQAIYNLAQLQLMQEAKKVGTFELIDLLFVASAYDNADAKYFLAMQPEIAVSDIAFVRSHLIRAAADSGDNAMRVNLAISILSGNDQTFNEIEAINLLSAASREGFSPADYNLGLWWLNNFEDSEANRIASAYLRRAADCGYGPAKDKLAEINKKPETE